MDKYSRQVGAYGIETMRFMRQLNVLVVGFKGVGAECSKDLVLSGPKGVDICDDSLVELADLGTNFFLTPDSVGKSRAEASLAALQELNDDVVVQRVSGELTEQVLSSYGAVVVTDASVPLETLDQWNGWCRGAGVPFFVALTTGVTGTLFSDFGDSHTVTDQDGEPHQYVAVENIAVVDDGDDGRKTLEVTLLEPHGMESGEQVQFEDVVGISQLSQGVNAETGAAMPSRAFTIKRVYATYLDDAGKERQRLVAEKLRLDLSSSDEDKALDVGSWGSYERGGFVREVKPTVALQFRRIGEALNADVGVTHPHTMRALLSAAGQQVLVGQMALWRFLAAHDGQLPALHSDADAKELAALAADAAKESGLVDEVNESAVRKMALYARAETSGLSAFLGGVIAQEVFKACGKWTPMHQWVVVDYFDLVQDEVPADAKPAGTRYDHQVALFGQAFQDKLADQRWFLVGCGALGCEYMKMFALMGVGTSERGLLMATDMDTIEVSNLARQFLFRRRHVGKMKSACAAETARNMNPELNLKVYEMLVAPSTENVFNDEFWNSLDGVCNALDNVKARLYVDKRCVFFHKPLLESGTLGTKANNEVVVPGKTASYGEGHVETKEKTIPACTLKNFPHLIYHCIHWAGRAGEFSNVFMTPASDLHELVRDPAKFWQSMERIDSVNERLERLEPLYALLKRADGATFDTCIELAFERFIKQYRTHILDLIHYLPRDAMKKDEATGEETPFWSAPKRFPTAASWDPEAPDAVHVDYLYQCANLFAHMFHLEHVRSRDEFAARIKALGLAQPEWKPAPKAALGDLEEGAAAAGSSDAADDDEDDGDDEDDKRLAELKEALDSYDLSALRARDQEVRAADESDAAIRAAEFEKDDDSNFHIDFITAASNLRALNYDIPTETRLKTKTVTGNIIPAVATTTAGIQGLNALELYKLVMGLPIDKFCNSNINLGVAQFSQFEPNEPKKAVAAYSDIEMCEVAPVPDGFTCWDQVRVDQGDLTLAEFIEAFPAIHHGCTPVGIEGYQQDGSDGEKDSQTRFIQMSFAPTATLRQKNTDHMSMKITDIWQKEYGELPAGQNYLLLNVDCEKDDDPVKIPNPVVFVYQK